MKARCSTLAALVLFGGLAASTVAQEAPQASGVAELMNSFHTIYVETGTWLTKPEMLQGAFMRHPEFDFWGMAITTRGNPDVVLKIDHQPGWFYYTYSMTHRATGTVLAAGKVTAWDGKEACNKVGDEVVKRILQYRPGPSKKKASGK